MTRLRRSAVLAVCFLSVVSLANLPRAGAQTTASADSRVQKYTEIGPGPVQVLRSSADGSTVIASTIGLGKSGSAFVWSPAGKVPVEYKGQTPIPQDISADGRVVVGVIFETHNKKDNNMAGVIHFVRWTREKGAEEIFSADYSSLLSVRQTVSPDGRTVVAAMSDTYRKTARSRMMRWVDGQGVKSEVMPQGWTWLDPITMSPDGAVVWGKYRDQSSTERAFRWSEPEGAKEISDDFTPISVSADGKVAYGTGVSDKQKVYRWTAEKGRELIVDFGAIRPKEDLTASAVSIDGTTVIGYVVDKADVHWTCRHLFRWTKADGFQILAFPEEKDVDPGFGVSSDGEVVSAGFWDRDRKGHLVVTPVADLLAAAQEQKRKENEAQAAQAQAAAQAKAEADQKEAELQAQTEKAMQGHPAQMYSFALRMEKEKRFDIAEKVYAALIEKYPDDPYTAKAIDRQEQAIEEEKAEKKAQQEALAQQAQDQQNAAAHELAANSCRSQCQSQYDSCASDVQAASNKNTANFLVGMMTKNSSMTQQSVNDASNASSLGDCTSAQNSCVAACQ
jgi:disulfide oxidoreductase YuzD